MVYYQFLKCKYWSFPTELNCTTGNVGIGNIDASLSTCTLRPGTMLLCDCVTSYIYTHPTIYHRKLASTMQASLTRCDQQHGGFVWTRSLSGSQHHLARYGRCCCCCCGILCIAAPSRPCLLRFQGRGPTRSSCWAADWLAAALHEGWVKWQTGPHDPAQPDSCLFQELFFFFLIFKDCSRLFKSWTAYHTIFTPAVRKQPFNSPLRLFHSTLSSFSALLLWIKWEQMKTAL